MRLYLKFVIPLFLVIGAVALGAIRLAENLSYRWFVRDLDIRASLIARMIPTEIGESATGKKATQQMLTTLVKDERLFAIAVCDASEKIFAATDTFPNEVSCKTSSHVAGGWHIVKTGLENGYSAVLLHDMSFVDRRKETTKRYLFWFFLGLGIVIAGISVVIAELSMRGWVSSLRKILRGDFRRGIPFKALSPEFRPIMKDLRGLFREMESDRASRDPSQLNWSPKALKEILMSSLAGDQVLIVSNREPYLHVKKGDKIEVQTPASGLVTALEPIMRACSGTWIAHGSGDADKDVVDKKDHVRVPPANPSYQIRRVWLTEEEEKGYYYGFSNEGMWPLCHVAHTRPIFRTEDWEKYVEVNRKFADAVIEEATGEDPVVLVQDYHFALLPRMIREKLPRATVITFWHIPWPNAEAFGICPWREQILDGMLGSTILGFHTQFHCNNFLDTVDRFMESRIERESSTISFGGGLTKVAHYPISIEYPVRWLDAQVSVKDARKRVRAANGFDSERRLVVGVDRLDYTKGILERFMAVERLLELDPRWIGKLSFVQIAAPSRSTILRYQQFENEVLELAAKINSRFGKPGYEPICLRVKHHTPDEVYEYFRGSDVCFVSSLHDGMNLVAKEFVASRDDEQGVLILSQFTGASRELLEALIVNPYNVDQCASALLVALEMSGEEQRARMRSMRALIQEFNVYRWAGRMLVDAARIRQRSRVLSMHSKV